MWHYSKDGVYNVKSVYLLAYIPISETYLKSVLFVFNLEFF